MKIKELIIKIKRKAFATYEYNERFNDLETNVLALNKNQEKLMQLQENISHKIDSLDAIRKEITTSQSEFMNFADHEINLVKNNIQAVNEKLEPLNSLAEINSSLVSSRMVLNSISKNTK